MLRPPSLPGLLDVVDRRTNRTFPRVARFFAHRVVQVLQRLRPVAGRVNDRQHFDTLSLSPAGREGQSALDAPGRPAHPISATRAGQRERSAESRERLCLPRSRPERFALRFLLLGLSAPIGLGRICCVGQCFFPCQPSVGVIIWPYSRGNPRWLDDPPKLNPR